MSENERAPSTVARSMHVVAIGAAPWADLAARVAPALARVDAAEPVLQALVLAPTAADVTDLTRALVALHAARGVRLAPAGSPRLARRLLAVTHPQVIVTTPAVAAALLRASALSPATVTGVALCAVDDLERDEAALAQVLAEVPRTAAKVLTAARATPFVERVIEQHLHGARRLSIATDGASAPTTTIEVVPVSSAAPAAVLAEVLEAVDPPSVAVVPADARREAAASDVLAGLGFAAGGPSVRLATDGDTGGAALLVLLGVPAPAVLARALATPAARTAALVTARERSGLAALAPTAEFVPFRFTAARQEAEETETQLRDRIRGVLLDGLPAREMVALEPLLADADALAVAGALVRLYERERDAARRLREAKADAPAAPRPRPDARPRAGSGPRRDDRGRPDSRPRRDDRARPDSRPRGDDRARPDSRPRRDDRARPDSRPRRDDRARPDSRPRGDDRARPDSRPRRDDRGGSDKRPHR